jgi:probable rRNA maturation factor
LGINLFSEYRKNSFFINNIKVKRFHKIAFFENKHIGNVNFIFVSDREIKIYNSKYLQHNYPTDTISFNYSQGSVISGDVYIGIDTVIYNSYKFSCSQKNEILRVMIHSLLHLIGYKDVIEKEKSRMHRLEEKYLKLFQ